MTWQKVLREALALHTTGLVMELGPAMLVTELL